MLPSQKKLEFKVLKVVIDHHHHDYGYAELLDHLKYGGWLVVWSDVIVKNSVSIAFYVLGKEKE